LRKTDKGQIIRFTADFLKPHSKDEGNGVAVPKTKVFMTVKFNSLTQLEAFSLSIDLLSVFLKNSPTPLEKETLIKFLLLPPKYQYAPFTTLPKRIVRQEFKIDAHTLNNRIYGLHKKKFLQKDEDDLLVFHPLLHNIRTKSSFTITIDAKILQEDRQVASADSDIS